MRRVGGFVRERLHRRIFVWFGAAILMTGAAVAIVMSLTTGWGPSFREEVDGARAFVADRFERVWDDPHEREDLARAIAMDLRADVKVVDRTEHTIVTFGDRCDRPSLRVPVRRDGKPLGHVAICLDRHRPRHPGRLILPLFAAGLVLWAFSGKIARRLARPLYEVTRVAQDIGAGKLSSRATIGRHHHGEARVLAESINEMAGRIQQQMKDQRELLAAVSHEIRTPLARIRLLAELLRESGSSPQMVDDLDREVVEIDDLVGQLLASSRVEFAALSLSDLDAVAVATRALERAGLVPADCLEAEGGTRGFVADPTLVARALANLLENAKKHGGGADRLRIGARGQNIFFEVEDRGPGLRGADENRIFESFYRGDSSGTSSSREEREPSGLGLGLALVRRIAEIHEGRAYARNRPGGGACVGIEFSVRGPRQPTSSPPDSKTASR